MRHAALLFGAGLTVGALAMYLLAGRDAGRATPTPDVGIGVERDAAEAVRMRARAPTIEFLELVAGSIDVAERTALHRLAAEADRATLESLATQVAALPKIPSRALALELLLSRYGELDAPAAVALARELDVDAAVIAPLFASWARRDARAALNALGELDAATAKTLGIALLEVFGNDDLGIIRVLGAAPRIDADRFRVDAAVAKAATDPSAAMQDALLLPASKSQAALAGIASVWGKNDPYGALANVGLIDDTDLRTTFTANVLRAWATTDSDAVLTYLLELPPAAQEEAMRTGVLQTALTMLEPLRALESADSVSGELGALLRRTALTSLARDDALAALRRVEALPPGAERQQMLGVVAQQYGRADPAAALAWAQSAAPEMLVPVLTGIARGDPERAVELAMSLPAAVDQQRVIQALVMSRALTSSQTATLANRLLAQQSRGSSLQMLANTWAQRAPEDALNWLLANGNGSTTRAIPQAGMHLATKDPEAAIRYLDRIPSELRASWIGAVAEGYALHDASAAASWVTQYRSEPGYDAAVGAIAARTAVQDPVVAARLFESIDVAQAPDAPSNARAIAASWVRRDAPAAARWAQGLADGETAAGAVAAVANQWVARDAAAARNWATSLPRSPARDAALVQVLGATAGTPSSDAAVVDGFSSPAALQEGVSQAVRIVAARDVEAARQLADRYLTDPGTRQAAERFIEQGANGALFAPPPPRVPAQR